MACTDLITQAVTNDCASQPVAGAEKKFWVLNRKEISTITEDTNPALITAIAMSSGKQAYAFTAGNRELNVGYDLVASPTFPDVFNHYFSFQPWAKDADSLKELKNMNDIVVIVEAKGEKSEGKFEIYGLKNGLHKSSGSKRVNDNRGVPTFEFTSMEGGEEIHPNNVFWNSDYATTLAALVTLETPAA